MKLKKYLKDKIFIRDAIAGLSVAFILLPEAIAYAAIAHLPMQSAIMGALSGLLCYAWIGRSPYAIVAPTSSSAALLFAIVLSLNSSNSVSTIQITAALVMITGSGLLLFAKTGMGRFSAYVSRPVLHGFSFAVATTIIIKQLPLIVGIHAQEKKPIPILIELFERINEWILPSIILGCIVLVLLRVVKHLIKLESTFLILMGGIFLSDQINLSHFHIELIGAVSMTRPVLAFPSLSLETWLQLTELGFGLIVIIVAESWGSIRSLAHHQAASALIEPNRELAALGVANLVSGLFQGMAVGAGFSASTVNKKSGSKTKRAGAIAAVILVFIVMWGEKWIGLLPQTLIAAVIIHTLSHAIRLKGLLALWRINRDQYIALSTIFFVLVFDILHGMLIAVGLSIASAVHTFSKPIVKELGELDDSRDYLDKLNHPYVKTYAHLLILRPEEPLFFANIEGVLIEIQKRLQKSDNIKIIVLSLEESVDLDSTAAQFLVEFDFQLQCQNKILLFARVKDPINALLLTLTDGKCLNRLFWSVDDAVKNAEKLKISNLPSPDE